MSACDIDTLELVGQAKVLYAQNNYNEAVGLLKNALTADAYCGEVYEVLCACYIMLNDYDAAEKTIRKYLLLNKNNGAAYFHLGNIALLQGKSAEAKAFYSKAELLGFTERVMYLNLASYYEDKGETEKAIEQYSKMLVKDKYDYEALLRKTQLQIRIGEYVKAFEAAKQMVSTDIDRFEGHHYVYICLIGLNRQEDAKKYLKETEIRFPENMTVKFDKIRLMDMMGETESALCSINRDFKKLEDYPQVAILKLGLLLKEKREPEAIALVSENPFMKRDEVVLTIMYTLYFSLGQYEKALEYCALIRAMGEQATEYFATYYFEPLARKKMGQEEKANQEFEASGKVLKKAGLKNPADYSICVYRALCEYQLNHFQEAKRLIEYVLAIAPEQAFLHLAASVIYDACGEVEEAAIHKETALRLDPNSVAPLV